MFHLLGYLIVGFIAGALAKMVMPGDKFEPKGCLMTTLLGCAGAMIVGFVMHTVLREPPGGFFGSIIGATLGAILILWVYGKSQSRS
ncbi:MAG: GlsB/YeaQ/YmgE family stress response membrane protein [Armatimonadetes bacterium]|nr:GlsB/YeaQ/YmgE family stress response membrane protein [Armatimonadota bacterium]